MINDAIVLFLLFTIPDPITLDSLTLLPTVKGWVLASYFEKAQEPGSRVFAFFFLYNLRIFSNQNI